MSAILIAELWCLLDELFFNKKIRDHAKNFRIDAVKQESIFFKKTFK